MTSGVRSKETEVAVAPALLAKAVTTLVMLCVRATSANPLPSMRLVPVRVMVLVLPWVVDVEVVEMADRLGELASSR